MLDRFNHFFIQHLSLMTSIELLIEHSNLKNQNQNKNKTMTKRFHHFINNSVNITMMNSSDEEPTTSLKGMAFEQYCQQIADLEKQNVEDQGDTSQVEGASKEMPAKKKGKGKVHLFVVPNLLFCLCVAFHHQSLQALITRLARACQPPSLF